MNYKSIFISGISSGIGYATAEFFLSQGHTVIGTYRKSADAVDFKTKYKNKFIGIEIDLTQFDQIPLISQQLANHGINQIDALVNNAGVALAAPIENQDFNEIQQIININVLAVIRLTQVLIPFLKKSVDARIVNISSVSGVNGTPFLGIYCASKHAIEGFSESLRRELNLFGIKVSIVGPGSIKTPIWSKGFDIVAHKYDATAYKESFHRFIKFASNEEKKALPVREVVKDIAHAIENSNPKIRYAPVPRKWSNWYLPKLFPKKIYDRLMCKALGLYKK